MFALKYDFSIDNYRVLVKSNGECFFKQKIILHAFNFINYSLHANIVIFAGRNKTL